MAKKKRTKKIENDKLPVPASQFEAFKNGLAEALFGFTLPGGTQLNQVDTLFVNLRWYLVSNLRQVCSEAYVEHGIVETAVDVPVNDAFRGGIEITSEELSPEEVRDLEAEMESNSDLQVAAQGEKWKRLFGGAGIIILTGEDWSLPLDEESFEIGDDLSFRAVDMWELFWDKQNMYGDGQPIDNEDFEHYSYYGHKVHKSRVFRLKGKEAPSLIRPRLRGWGLSILEVIVNSINQYLKSNNLSFEVLDEFKIDIFAIKGLTQALLGPNGTQKIQERVALANKQKNYQHALTMDSEDRYEQKQLTFSGLAETMVGIRMQIASDLRMPLSKVFGIAATGFSSGEDDIENYNAMVESTIRTQIKPYIVRMVKMRCLVKFGYIPSDLKIDFHPLRVLSKEQQENVKNSQSARVLEWFKTGLLSVKEAKDAANKAELLPIPLDTKREELDIGAQIGANGPGGANPEEGAAPATAPKEAGT